MIFGANTVLAAGKTKSVEGSEKQGV